MSRAYASPIPGNEACPPSGVRRRTLGTVRPIALIVVERGSNWPSGLDLGRNTGDCDCVLIAQQYDENPSMLADRVVRKLCAIRDRGAAIERATFATGLAAGADGCDARSRIARALLASSTVQACGAIDFVTHPAVGEEAKRELLALAGTLVEQVGLEGPAIRVRFAVEAPELPSGVRRALPRTWVEDEPTPLAAC